MTEELIKNETVNEIMYMKTLPSQMKCYIIPKKGYIEKQAMLAVNYGSVDNVFEMNEKRIEQPDGIAHFLEHKLFEDKKKNIFDEFTKLGASANAFTNFTNTAYYFNCIDNFDDNLKLLLNFTNQPYFTDENVEKEKGIIQQEIEMYDDNPFWNIYLNMQDAMYKSCPIKKNIAGSVESIQQITKDLLYECYDAFYKPENMVLVCVGDIEPERVFEKAAKWSKDSKMSDIKRIYGEEPPTVSKNYIEQSMTLSRPMVELGFKDNDFESSKAQKIAEIKTLMDIAVGESSAFFEKLYNDAIVDSPFVLEYLCGNFFGTAVFSNSGREPNRIADLIKDELKKLQSNKIDQQRFEQIKRKHIGRYIRSFNNINSIASGQADFYFKDMSIFDIIDAYSELEISAVQNRLNNFFKEDNYVVSVINPA